MKSLFFLFMLLSWIFSVFVSLPVPSVAADTATQTESASSDFFQAPNRNPHQTHINLIQNAKKSIYLEMFHLTDMDVTDALVAAKERGVDVKVILDGTQLRSNTSQAVTQKLDAHQVKWVKSSPAFSITHTKAMLVDEATALVSSMNLTMAGQSWRDWGVLTSDSGIIQEMKSVFEQDITNSQTGGKDTPVLKEVNLLWSPINSKDKLKNLIQSAQSSIEVTVENFTNTEIADELVKASSRGVNVRVLTPASPSGAPADLNKNISLKLISGGVSARQIQGPATDTNPYLHGKDMIIDHKLAYMGSINFSKNSIENARELGIILHEPSQLQNLVTDFEADWKVGVVPTATSTPGLNPPGSNPPASNPPGSSPQGSSSETPNP